MTQKGMNQEKAVDPESGFGWGWWITVIVTIILSLIIQHCMFTPPMLTIKSYGQPDKQILLIPEDNNDCGCK